MALCLSRVAAVAAWKSLVAPPRVCREVIGGFNAWFAYNFKHYLDLHVICHHFCQYLEGNSVLYAQVSRQLVMPR